MPLLTSIDDQRDVAIVRALHAGEKPEEDTRQRAALDPLVASCQPVRRYVPADHRAVAEPALTLPARRDGVRHQQR